MKILLSKLLLFIAYCSLLSIFIVIPYYISGRLPNPVPQTETIYFAFIPLGWLFAIGFYVIFTSSLYIVFRSLSIIILVGWHGFVNHPIFDTINLAQKED